MSEQFEVDVFKAKELASDATAMAVAKAAGELKHVAAAVKWNSTGINVRQGDRVDIWADPDYVNVWQVSPSVRCGPEGDSRWIGKPGYALPGRPEGCLVARIGSYTFFIGREGFINSPTAGELMLSANDDLDGRYGRGYDDNSGAVAVRVSVR